MAVKSMTTCFECANSRPAGIAASVLSESTNLSECHRSALRQVIMELFARAQERRDAGVGFFITKIRAHNKAIQ